MLYSPFYLLSPSPPLPLYSPPPLLSLPPSLTADCNEKFASEADYNVHLNTHMNYRHKCQVAGCGHAFLTRKRLELHCRVMHGVELQSESSSL